MRRTGHRPRSAQQLSRREGTGDGGLYQANVMTDRNNGRGPLPFMRTREDAVALSEKEKDNFYITAFMIEAWLGQTVLDNVAEYAEKKNPRERAMQTGQAWRLFLEVFG